MSNRRLQAQIRAAVAADLPSPTGVPRSFAVHADGQVDPLTIANALRLAGVSPAASAAYDIMADDGVPPERAWDTAFAAERDGIDPETFARHFVKLRKFYRNDLSN